MSTPKKGFDPLASLFDLPEAPTSRPMPVAPPPAVGDDLPESPHVKSNAPAPQTVSAPQSSSAPPTVSAPVPPGPDPAQLAKILAKAAAAKAAMSAPVASPVPKPEPKAAPRAAAPKSGPPGTKLKPSSLASRLAPPPKKALSADEALAAARAEETARLESEARQQANAQEKAQEAKRIAAAALAAAANRVATPPPVTKPAPVRPDQLADLVAGIVGTAVPEVGAVYMVNALLMDDRGVLAALWRAHRGRFAARGDLDGAVACTAVIRALTTVPIGQLAAAHAATDKTDWLVWVDLVSGSPIAAFRDARAWFGQG